MTPFQSKNQRTGARGAGLAAALAVAVSLAGCGPADTGMQRDTAHQLQELVLGVSQAAAANDHAAALKTLDSLEADVATAAGSGQVSEERRRKIMTSITAVRADLNAAADAAAAAAKAAGAVAAAAAEAEKTKTDAEAAAQAAQENTAPVVPVPVPAPAPAPEQGKGEGKGKNKNG
ncbi:hypothetical protein [Pseudarthrobacter cellobiosi]|uniref:hypothetical protein n=1 Tax=Pseudarthrobacter cellobiosi TaxID=2953654 RepID=UPI00208FD6D7|nr:hypothetical protein [Pseudarthrobacter sp. HLT1-5]MCO4254078.1 hypothetical protein [Pseudarthrobacter sp. HLT1-5]